MHGGPGGSFVVRSPGGIAMSVFRHPLHRHAVVPERGGIGGSGLSATAALELRAQREQRIDEELAQSFPASDPPSWVQGVSPRPS
jgi:hypothetical protein